MDILSKMKKWYRKAGIIVTINDTLLPVHNENNGIIISIGKHYQANDPTVWWFNNEEEAWKFTKFLKHFPKAIDGLIQLNYEIETCKKSNRAALRELLSRPASDRKSMLEVVGFIGREFSGVYTLLDQYGDYYPEIIHERFMYWLVDKEYQYNVCYHCEHCALDQYDETGWMNCRVGLTRNVTGEMLAQYDKIMGDNQFELTVVDGKFMTDLCIYPVKRCKNYQPTKWNKAKILKLLVG